MVVLKLIYLLIGLLYQNWCLAFTRPRNKQTIGTPDGPVSIIGSIPHYGRMP